MNGLSTHGLAAGAVRVGVFAPQLVPSARVQVGNVRVTARQRIQEWAWQAAWAGASLFCVYAALGHALPAKENA